VAKKVSLRVFDDQAPAKAKVLGKKPSIDAARERLGGRVLDEDEPPTGIALGQLVAVAGPRGTPVPGVVIFASRSEVHVLLDGIRLRRVLPDAVRPFGSEVSLALSKIAGDAHLFAQLREGQAVRYAGDDGHLVTAKVVEKCRWGALVARADGAVIAVGFRKLWPNEAHGDA
jgi:hypothetical protein